MKTRSRPELWSGAAILSVLLSSLNSAPAIAQDHSVSPAATLPATTSAVLAPAPAFNWLGVWLREPGPREGARGMVVEWVAPRSPADGRISLGDSIGDVDGRVIHTLIDTRAALKQRSWEEGLPLTIIHRGHELNKMLYPTAAPALRPLAVVGRFTGERYTGLFKGLLDPVAHTAVGSMQGKGAGTVDLVFTGPWDPATGNVKLDLNGHVRILFTVSLHGTADGTVDPAGKGSGRFEGTSAVGGERGEWQCLGAPADLGEF